MNFTKNLLSATMAEIQPIMANTTERLPENLPGRYYVDATCIDCDGCRNIAPAFFTRQDEIGFSIVHRQPSTPEELALAEEAREGCPSDSIGNDGDKIAP
jgi:ferredoxin